MKANSLRNLHKNSIAAPLDDSSPSVADLLSSSHSEALAETPGDKGSVEMDSGELVGGDYEEEQVKEVPAEDENFDEKTSDYFDDGHILPSPRR